MLIVFGSNFYTLYHFLIQIQDAYVRMNTYNAVISPQNLHHIVCLWDGDGSHKSSANRIEKELQKLWLLAGKNSAD